MSESMSAFSRPISTSTIRPITRATKSPRSFAATQAEAQAVPGLTSLSPQKTSVLAEPIRSDQSTDSPQDRIGRATATTSEPLPGRLSATPTPITRCVTAGARMCFQTSIRPFPTYSTKESARATAIITSSGIICRSLKITPQRTAISRMRQTSLPMPSSSLMCRHHTPAMSMVTSLKRPIPKITRTYGL